MATPSGLMARARWLWIPQCPPPALATISSLALTGLGEAVDEAAARSPRITGTAWVLVDGCSSALSSTTPCALCGRTGGWRNRDIEDAERDFT